MFFVLSKTIGFLAFPSNLLIAVALAGVILMATRWARCGRRTVVTAVLLLALAGLSPLGNALIMPLERRFPAWTFSGDPPTGIIVLGGAIIPRLSGERGTVELNESAERMTEMAALARRFPQARIVFVGGDASLVGHAPSEAVLARPLLESLGVAAQRIETEEASRNTYENAAFAKALLRPKLGERWLLVTSGYHMPRAVGCFRRVGFEVEPYPVDWRTAGRKDLLKPFRAVGGGLARTDVAMREWVGLVAYWLTGQSSELFPGPRSPGRAVNRG
ncbi:MAG: YdcF family protein [Rhizobiales bacterium]|nr:YdcF family protein [Hyphomicrobiales bacterium]